MRAHGWSACLPGEGQGLQECGHNSQPCMCVAYIPTTCYSCSARHLCPCPEASSEHSSPLHALYQHVKAVEQLQKAAETPEKLQKGLFP